MPVKAKSTNKLLSNPAAPKIVAAYNDLLLKHGKVNGSAFWREVIRPEIPDYALDTWLGFLTRFKTSLGISVNKVGASEIVPHNTPMSLAEEMASTMRTVESATQFASKTGMNMGMEALQELYRRYKENPASLTNADLHKLADYTFKTMKAQDSRVHALGKIKESDRADRLMARAFDESIYE